MKLPQFSSSGLRSNADLLSAGQVSDAAATIAKTELEDQSISKVPANHTVEQRPISVEEKESQSSATPQSECRCCDWKGIKPRSGECPKCGALLPDQPIKAIPSQSVTREQKETGSANNTSRIPPIETLTDCKLTDCGLRLPNIMKDINWRTVTVGLVCGVILGFGLSILLGQPFVATHARFTLVHMNNSAAFRMDTVTGETWLVMPGDPTAMPVKFDNGNPLDRLDKKPY